MAERPIEFVIADDEEVVEAEPDIAWDWEFVAETEAAAVAADAPEPVFDPIAAAAATAAAAHVAEAPEPETPIEAPVEPAQPEVLPPPVYRPLPPLGPIMPPPPPARGRRYAVHGVRTARAAAGVRHRAATGPGTDASDLAGRPLRRPGTADPAMPPLRPAGFGEGAVLPPLRLSAG